MHRTMFFAHNTMFLCNPQTIVVWPKKSLVWNRARNAPLFGRGTILQFDIAWMGESESFPLDGSIALVKFISTPYHIPI